VIARIRVASREQGHGIELIGTAIAPMDEVTQQNAALVEQSAAAARPMANQANVPGDMVSGFRPGSDGPASRHDGDGPDRKLLAKAGAPRLSRALIGTANGFPSIQYSAYQLSNPSNDVKAVTGRRGISNELTLADISA
jgi:hypothetical protein